MKTFLCLFLVVPAAHCFQSDDEQVITRTLQFAGEPSSRSILVDNTHGSVTVKVHDAAAVELKAYRRTHYESPAKLREANEDVLLDIREQRNRIEITVDAPWRDRWEGNSYSGYRYYGYEVIFDFELMVPRTVDLYLRTVNDGEIEVEGVRGVFEIKNVNGGVTMKNIVGSGRFTTVNGSLRIDFSENPVDECLFRTVNGKIEVSFQDPLSADLMMKTFNGKAYTDFDVVGIPAMKPAARERRGRTVFKAGDAYAVRAGGGGPKLGFDTLNGSIYILKH